MGQPGRAERPLLDSEAAWPTGGGQRGRSGQCKSGSQDPRGPGPGPGRGHVTDDSDPSPARRLAPALAGINFRCRGLGRRVLRGPRVFGFLGGPPTSHRPRGVWGGCRAVGVSGAVSRRPCWSVCPGRRAGSEAAAGTGAAEAMEDDEFGGFEAAETFDGGDGGTQTTSPAVPWAAFPTVSGVHLPPSPETLLDREHSSPSIGCLPSDAAITSPGNTHADSSIIQQATHTHLDIPLFPLGLTDETSHGAVAPEEAEDSAVHASNTQLQQKISSLEAKLKASEEEKQRIRKDVESLMEKHSVLEKDFLKEKEQEAISFQDRYRELQEKHKQELEDMRKAGHEALSIIVDEYKALLQSSVKQQVEAMEKQYASAIEKQAQKCEELLHAQHQRLLEVLDTEKELLREKIKEALTQQSQEQKEILGKCLEEELHRSKEALESAAKLEQEAVKDLVMKAVEEERRHLGKVHAEERELWKAEHAKDQEKVTQAIQTAVQEQRQLSQETVKAALTEEQKRSEKAMEEAVRRTRDELVEYVKEQKRLDQVVRQRSLSSLELFLSCAQKQLSALIATEPGDIE